MLNLLPRFPRPRGDGPHTKSRCPGKTGVSPPTRGWPVCLSKNECALMGFPAHAGMAPRHSQHKPSNRRFPRPRGDGPPKDLIGIPWMVVSPPTRGWPASIDALFASSSGFPAHAGMAPEDQTGNCWVDRFPRPRGDGPVSYKRCRSGKGVSPPTRGWPRRYRRDTCNSVGFPAHAGMARIIGEPTIPPTRFPRPRGDGPLFAHGAAPYAWVSPPTRGWPRNP